MWRIDYGCFKLNVFFLYTWCQIRVDRLDKIKTSTNEANFSTLCILLRRKYMGKVESIIFHFQFIGLHEILMYLLVWYNLFIGYKEKHTFENLPNEGNKNGQIYCWMRLLWYFMPMVKILASFVLVSTSIHVAKRCDRNTSTTKTPITTPSQILWGRGSRPHFHGVELYLPMLKKNWGTKSLQFGLP